jgi:hypothetical protein
VTIYGFKITSKDILPAFTVPGTKASAVPDTSPVLPADSFTTSATVTGHHPVAEFKLITLEVYPDGGFITTESEDGVLSRAPTQTVTQFVIDVEADIAGRIHGLVVEVVSETVAYESIPDEPEYTNIVEAK